MKVAIIGGGAAGLTAAILSKNDDNEVVILERNSECGKKILATGNGKCNYWNSNQRHFHYESSTEDLIPKIINEETEQEVLNFFNNLGVLSKIKNGYFYPNSNQASTIRDLLVEECREKNIIIKTNYLVEKIEKINNGFLINNVDYFDAVVLSTGSLASPKTGSTGMGYDFLEKFNHYIRKPLPALVQLITRKESYLNEWKGIRTDVSLLHVDSGKIIRKEEGEIQLTDYGISGICVFNLSNKVARGLDEHRNQYIFVDFLPSVTKEKLRNYLEKNKSLEIILTGLLNKKLVKVILNKNKIDGNKKYNDLSKNEKVNLEGDIKSFALEIVGTKTFEESQVCSGGVSLSEIDLSKMESKKVSNLYIIGELLDLTGDCGGYNLGIAWRSAILAAKAIRGKTND